MDSRLDLSHAAPATSPITKKTFLFAITAVALTSAALYWGTGLHPQWWLTWFAPLPVLLISPRVTRWRAFWMAAVAWFLGSLNMWFYFLTAIAISDPPLVSLLGCSELSSSDLPSCYFEGSFFAATCGGQRSHSLRSGLRSST